MEGRHCFLFHFRVFTSGLCEDCVRLLLSMSWGSHSMSIGKFILSWLATHHLGLCRRNQKHLDRLHIFCLDFSDSSMIPRAPKMTDTGCSSHLFCAVVKALGFKNKQPCFKIIKTQKILNKASNQTTPKQTLKSGLVGREMGRAAVTSPLSWDHPVCPWSSWLWLALVTIQWGELRFVQSNYLYALHLVFKERNWKSRFELRWCWMW